jgi:hypothetical protein
MEKMVYIHIYIYFWSKNVKERDKLRDLDVGKNVKLSLC